jgi:eukaryotic-like serine/threonine-protein kinase
LTLTAGTRLGPYEIVAALGAGGMGEVYRARDTTLDRDVAIKILPDAFAGDAERVARFQREARVLASLNHPNIAIIHGLEQAGDVHALVMELVPGEDLSQRIARGPIPLEEALPIARQIAEALEAAHEQGIVHRDLKPANIKVRPDGTVKVLDFGLAKAMESPASLPGLSQSPTLTSPAMLTGMSVILGTAAYMSPEQAVGRPADKRSDVWAFGVVLMEMLTGRPVFAGETVSHVLAAVLKSAPDWTTLPAHTPAPIRTLLRRCLEKDRRQRLADASDARLEIDETLTAGGVAPASAAPVRHARLPWVVAALATIAAAAAVALWAPWRTALEPARVAFEIQTPYGGGTGPLYSLAISPDGTHIVARVGADGDVDRLWVRPLARLEGVTLARTDGAWYPFWSPDGKTVGFFADGKLKKIDISGTAPQTLADSQFNQGGGTWNRDGVILFAPRQDGPLYRVAEDGGPVVPVTELDATRGDTSHRFPRFLPDGVHYLYLVISSKPESAGIYLGSLASKEAHRIVGAVNKPEFAPPDLLLFLRESTLMAQRIDINTSQIVGAPFRVVEPVLSGVNSNGNAAFSVSDNGVLAYRTGSSGAVRELAWVDRSGKRVGSVGVPAGYENPRLSPNRRRLAVFKPEGGGGDIWVTELETTNTAKLTSDPASDKVPLWSPDGTRIAFVSDRAGGVFNIYQKNAGGTGDEDLLLETPHSKTLNDWSPGGGDLLYEEVDAQGNTDVWRLPLVKDPSGRIVPGKALPLLNDPSYNESEATFSSDGRWIAYTSDETRSRQVYVQKFPTADRKWPVSAGALIATHPRWGSNGKELFFDTTGTLTAVRVTGLEPGGEFTPSAPTRLFNGLGNPSLHNFDIADDAGQRFLVLMAPGSVTGDAAPLTIVVNWKSGLSLGR